MNRLLISVLIILIIFILLGWYFSNITLYFLFSLVLAATLRPLTNRINDIHIFGQSIPRWTAILFSYIFILSVIFLISLLFIPLIRAQVGIISELDVDFLYDQIQRPVGRIEEILIRWDLVKDEPGFLIEIVRNNLIQNFSEINIQGFINSIINVTSSFLISLLAIAFISFFLLLENGLLRRNIIQLVPNKYFELSVSTFHQVEQLLSNYLIGLLIQMTAIFSLASLGLSIMEVDYAFTIAVFAAVANLIPYAGPFMGTLFGLLVGLSTGDFTGSGEVMFFVIKVASVFAMVQVVDNILLQPLIFSKSVKAHPLEIFVVIFAGAKIAGVLGMIFAIPIYTIFRVSFKEFYKGYQEYQIFKI
jgi:predicted PurR-regulated permease PerM